MVEPVTYQVRIARRAQQDLREIYEYIKVDSPRNAKGMIGRLLGDISRLSILPHRYAVPRTFDVEGRDIRCMPVGNYLVYYRIEEAERKVRVISVQHGARRPRL